MRDDILRSNFDLETGAHRQGLHIIAGGAIAGPVVAAAVILNPAQIPSGIDDSKRLSPSWRAATFQQIRATSFIGLGFASHHRVDRDNILQASLWALARAVPHLPLQPDLVLVDGPIDIPCPSPTRPIVRGDQISLSIAAASIVAKVIRDRFMENTSRIHRVTDSNSTSDTAPSTICNASKNVAHHIFIGKAAGLFPFAIRLDELNVGNAKSLGQFIKSNDRWIAFSALQAAQILLTKAGSGLDLLLGQTLFAA